MLKFIRHQCDFISLSGFQGHKIQKEKIHNPQLQVI